MFKIIRKNKISNPPYEYNFLLNLEKSDYPKYLKKIFKYRTGEDLPLLKELSYKIDEKKLKTFNQKIQWIKLYGITPLMRDCTDKVKVRDFVCERIGAEYLKPVLQIIPECNCEFRDTNCVNLSDLNSKTGWTASDIFPRSDKHPLPLRERVGVRGRNYDLTTYFDQINWDKLPDSFVIKCNHGCKWQFIIKSKNQFLNNERLFNQIKQQITGWLEQEFWSFEGFELNYKGIEPKILIEPFMLDERCKVPRAIEIFCFNGIPKIFVDIQVNEEHKICVYNEDFSYSDLILHPNGKMLITQIPADELIKQAVELSKTLSKEFKFVRVDWMVYQDKLYFEELTFTPYSGFTQFDKKWNLKLGNWIEI